MNKSLFGTAASAERQARASHPFPPPSPPMSEAQIQPFSGQSGSGWSSAQLPSLCKMDTTRIQLQ